MSGLGTVVVVVLLGAALLRMLTAQVALPVFDIDPMLAPGGQPGISPGPSLILDAVVLLAAAFGLFVEWRSGRRIHMWIVVAALLPAVSILAQIDGPIDDVWRGATWLSSIVAGVALCHLLREAALRRLALAILLGGLTVVAVRGAVQVAVEHPRMVEAFGSLREELLADRGWSDGSASTRVFEDRLRQREATGWFGLSNVFSSAMVVACVMASGLGMAAWRAARGRGIERSAMPIVLLAVAALVLLAVNGSKGAIASLAVGALLLGLGASARPVSGRAAIAMALTLPVMALLAVIARGVLLPEGFVGERSVLFRWHYLSDAAAVFAAHPVVGVGPAGFQQAMVAVRPPHHAEEVVSAHNVAADWLVCLGVLGAAWIAVLVGLLRWAGRDVADDAGVAEEAKPSAHPATGPVPLGSPRAALACVLLVSMLALWIESATLDVALLVLRLVAIGAGLAVVAGSWWVVAEQHAASSDDPGARAGRCIRWGVFAAAVALVVHSQIEMTFWLHGAVPWAIATLAIAGPAPAGGSPRRWRSPMPPMACLVMVLLAVGAMVRGFAAWRTERVVREAAVPLERLGEARALAPMLASRTDGSTIAALESALLGAGAPRETVAAVVGRLSSASSADRAIALRTVEEALGDVEERARQSAIGTLEPLALDRDIRPLLVLAEQAVKVAPLLTSPERRALLMRAEEQVAYSRSRGGAVEHDHRLMRAQAELLEALARHGDQAMAQAAAVAWAKLAERDPCSITLQLRRADSASRAGDRDVEQAALRRVLEIDQALRLDPRRRLTPEQRADIERRLKARSAQ